MIGSAYRKTHGEGDWRHGKRTVEYATWLDMRWRCSPDNKATSRLYSLRGITVCERWNEYESFLADMGRKPTPRHEIDRIDCDKGYEPNNCRWATERTQALNRRGAIYVYLDGRLMPLSDAAVCLGMKYKSLYANLEKIEWDSPNDYQAALDSIKTGTAPPTLKL